MGHVANLQIMHNIGLIEILQADQIVDAVVLAVISWNDLCSLEVYPFLLKRCKHPPIALMQSQKREIFHRQRSETKVSEKSQT